MTEYIVNTLVFLFLSFFFLFFSDLPVPRRIYVCDRFQFARPQAATFRFRGVCACRHHLSVSGPLDFRLVIQVLLSPHMILNACVCRLHPQFYVPRGRRRRGSNLGPQSPQADALPMSYIPAANQISKRLIRLTAQTVTPFRDLFKPAR